MKKYLVASALVMTLNLGAAENDVGPKTGEFVWNELATPNVQKAKDFYGKVFGWEFTDSKMGDKNVGDKTYVMIKKGDKEFGGIWAIPAAQKDQIPPHWLAYILVDDLNQSLDKARQNGATVVKPVQKVGDMGQFAVIQDPTGAHVALWQSLQKQD